MYRYVYHINSVYTFISWKVSGYGVRKDPLISPLPVYYQSLLPFRATISIIVISSRPRRYMLCRMLVCSSRTSPSYVMRTLTIYVEISSTFISADMYVYIYIYIYILKGQIFERVTM